MTEPSTLPECELFQLQPNNAQENAPERSQAHEVLLQKIEAFQFDQHNTLLRFSQRLARENGWTEDFALRVIEEYKRFVFLAMVAGHKVTPSDQVDQAWHLHLTYTRSYWEDLCGKVLKTPLHHGPTRGGQSESLKFNDWYGRTLASYKTWFNALPPDDIWPDSKTRFGRDANFTRINTLSHWVVPKPNWLRPLSVSALMLLAVSVVASAVSIGFALASGWGSTDVVDQQSSMFGLGAAADERLADSVSVSSFFSNTQVFLGAVNPELIFFVVVAIFLLVSGVGIFFRNRCPRCNKSGALKRTRERKKHGLFQSAKVKMKCRYCDHSVWKSDKSNSGSGCGSDAGSSWFSGDDSGCGSGCGGAGCGGGCGGD